jgi:type I restriction enzyme S subunit
VSAVLTAQEPSAKYLVNLQPPLVRHFDLIANAPGGVARLRELILTLAVQGKLVPQDPSDEPASELLKKIRAEKDRLIAEGKIKRDKPLADIPDEEKPFELPVGWAWERFGAIAGIERGGSPRPIESFLTDDPSGLNWIKIGDTEKGGKYITSASQKIKREGLVKTRMVYPGDFLLTNSMSFGRPYITQIEGCIHDGWLRISPPSSLDKDFLYALLSSRFIRTVFEAAAAGAVVLNLNADKVRTVPIPLPPLAEQSRIVNRVEELMKVCDALEASGQLEAQQHAQLVNTLLGTLTQSETPEALADNWQRIATHFDVLLDRPEAVDDLEKTILQLAVRGLLVPRDPTDEAASALLQRVTHLKAANSGKKKKLADDELPLPPYTLPTGWVWAQLGELVENMGSGWSPACDEGERSEPTQWAVLRTTAVQVNEFRSREHKVIPSKLSPRPEIEVKDGDILITRAGPMNRVGISCWVDRTPPRLMLSDKIVRFHSVADEMLPAFIVLTLNAGWTKEQIEAAKSGMAASQVNISQADLRSFWVPVCSKAEQSRIVTRVNELCSLCADLRQRLTAGQTKQKLLADALVTA